MLSPHNVVGWTAYVRKASSDNRFRPMMKSPQGSNMDSEVLLRELLNRFEGHLAAVRKSANTLLAYTRGLRLFGEWFALTNAKALSRTYHSRRRPRVAIVSSPTSLPFAANCNSCHDPTGNPNSP
jgi:hypothetical protein